MTADIWTQLPIPSHGPRKTKLTRAARSIRVTFTASVAVLLAAGGWLGYRDAGRYERLIEEGRVVQATVTEMAEHRGKSASYSIDYTFQLEGREFSDSDKVSRELFTSVKVGSLVTLTVAASDPSVHRIGTVDSTQLQVRRLAWIGGTLLVALIVEGIGLYFESETRKQRRALSHWIAAPARVMNIDLSQASEHCKVLFLEYRTEAGTLRKTSTTVWNSIADKFPIGSDVVVLVNPSNFGECYLLEAITFAELEPV